MKHPKTAYEALLMRKEWKDFAAQVKEHYGWKCQACKAIDKPLHAHHKKYVKGRYPWQYHLDLMACLCDECHEFHHSGYFGMCCCCGIGLGEYEMICEECKKISEEIREEINGRTAQSD